MPSSAPFASAALLSVALAVSSFAAEPTPTIRQQIDALLRQRLRPEPLPTELPNPFQAPTAMVRPRAVVTEPEKSAEEAEAQREAARPRDSDILADFASRLRIGGIIRLKDQVLVVINDIPRKEGDYIPLPGPNSRATVVITRLMSDRMVLRYQDAELTISF